MRGTQIVGAKIKRDFIPILSMGMSNLAVGCTKSVPFVTKYK